MFCIQCEQTKHGGCRTEMGNCGKDAGTAGLQDLLIYALKGISMYAHRARQLGAVDRDIDGFLLGAFFTTLTNVNFDEDRFLELISEATSARDKAKALYETACKDKGQAPEALDGPATFALAKTKDALLAQAGVAAVDVGREDVGDAVIGLRALLLYGLKGCAAYAEHARRLGQESDEVMGVFHEIFDFAASEPTDPQAILGQALKTGEVNLEVMRLLDEGHTSRFGHPEISQVRVTPVKGKCLLVSGHDLVDLEAVLKQTEGKGINVYTHGEMLPANAYPKLKAYSHLAGNYGGAWQAQRQEFADFPGAIVMTSNCLMDPNIGGYADRIFTCGPVGWPDVVHIEGENFSPAIEKTLSLPGFETDAPEQTITTGFARNTVLGVADKVLDAVKTGAISHFFLVGGCDGAKFGRNYFHDIVEQAPKDSVILTLGCGKYRFNKQDFGDIGGIPRLLDVGQCNDAYSAIQIAVALADALDCGVNDLPLSLVVSWFEQKAAAVLLTLLHLGIKNIHLGPTLPQYLTPDVVNILVEAYDLKPTGTVEEDLKQMLTYAA